MKKFLFLIVLLTFGLAIDYYAQQTYSPSSPTYRKDIYKDGNNSVQTGGLITGSTTTKYYIGKNSTIRKRAVYQWDINDNVIPNGSTVNSVRLAFLYTAPGTGEVFPPRFFNDGLDLQSASLTDLWANTDPATQTGISDRSATLDWKFDYTFIPGSDQAFIDAFQNSLSSNKFILGVAWKYETPSAGNQQWQLHYDILLEINFTPPTKDILVDQKLLDNSSVDSIGLWNLTQNQFDMYSAPKTFTWNLNDTKTLQGSQKVLSNQKYNYWLNEQNVVNHHSFIIEPSTSQLTSQFNPTNPGITIKNSLEGTNVDGGEVRFKDPWLIDYPDPLYGNTLRNQGMSAPFREQSSPFSPDLTSAYNGYVYKGIFTNQLFNSGTYYSVGSLTEQPITVNGQSRKFYPVSWGGTGVTLQSEYNPETGIVFTASNAVATATLKGQLMSNSTTGISSNSQRKMVRTDNGIYHAIYESMGNVFYIHSLTSNFDGEWAADMWVYDHAKNPAIEYDGNIVKAVLEYYDPAFSTNVELHLITFTQQPDGRYGFTDDESFATCPSSYFGSAKPVISYNPAGVALVYRNNSTEGLKVKTKWLLNGIWTWQAESTIPQTDANSINPSIIGETGKIHIAFESQSSIKYKLAYNQGQNWLYYSLVNLSTGSGFSQNNYPSISLSNGNPKYVMISWTGVYLAAMDKQIAKEQEESIRRYAAVAKVGYGTSWGGFSNFSNNVKFTNNNSINSTAGSILAWSESNGQYSKFVKRNSNGTYGTITNLLTNNPPIQAQGIQPLVSNGSSFSDLEVMVFNTSTSAPYLLNKCTNNFTQSALAKVGETETIDISYGRSGVVEKNGMEFLFSIGDVLIDGQTISFVERVDTLPVVSIDEMNLAARTNTFSLNSESELIFLLRC